MRGQFNLQSAILLIVLVVGTNSCSNSGSANAEATREAYIQSTLTAISAFDATVQARAYARYAAHARVFEVPDKVAAHALPRCGDPDDQKFLELAWHTRARYLLTRDQALLKLAPRVAKLGCFEVMAPQAFALQR